MFCLHLMFSGCIRVRAASVSCQRDDAATRRLTERVRIGVRRCSKTRNSIRCFPASDYLLWLVVPQVLSLPGPPHPVLCASRFGPPLPCVRSVLHSPLLSLSSSLSAAPLLVVTESPCVSGQSMVQTLSRPRFAEVRVYCDTGQHAHSFVLKRSMSDSVPESMRHAGHPGGFVSR